MLNWIKWIVKEHRAIAAFVIFILSIAGVSIYGNVNEINPWATAVEELIEDEVSESAVPLSLPIPASPVKIIEKTIETRIESGITEQQVQDIVNARWKDHIEEFH